MHGLSVLIIAGLLVLAAWLANEFSKLGVLLAGLHAMRPAFSNNCVDSHAKE